MRTCTKCQTPRKLGEFRSYKKGSRTYIRRSCRDCERKAGRKYYATHREQVAEKNHRYYRENPEYFEEYRGARREKYSRQAVECHRRARHERYDRIRALKESSPCKDCDHHYPHYVMDFDHLDSALKVADVSSLVKRGVSWPKVLDEVGKCDLVCANCHRLRTYKGNNSYKTRLFHYHKAILDELKRDTPCLDCGKRLQPCQMDFDHIDSTEKSANVARLVGSPTEELLEELGKCHLVCANCHRVRTATGERSEGDQQLISRFREIQNHTPYPEDRRFEPFPLPTLLGVIPDKELSAKTGISRQMVAWYRRKSGVVLNQQGERISA